MVGARVHLGDLSGTWYRASDRALTKVVNGMGLAVLVHVAIAVVSRAIVAS